MSIAIATGAATHKPLTYERLVVITILISILVRLLCAASVPLAFDEALYWRYSKHLAPGFLDHPMMNPLMIRIGTSIFGDTEFGVRFMSILLGLPATWAVWRAAAILFRDEKIGTTAALFFNLTAVMTVGSLLATSDEIVVVTTCFLLYFLAKVNETGRGEWWLAVGVAFGLGMFSKYTTLFFAVSIFAWLLLVPERRKWLLSPWPWAGALIALAIFSPVLIWNAEHQWASVVYQSSRMVVHKWSLQYAGELVASQLGLATPPLFVLGCIGLFWGSQQDGAPRSARILIGAMVWPVVIYFLWHSLHERVQGNWPEPIYPAFVIAAAYAAQSLQGSKGSLAKWAQWSQRCAAPVGLFLAGAVYVQAIFGVVPMGIKDPTARELGAGWTNLAPQIDAIRARVGAHVVLTTDYTLDSWLAFYLPSRTPVEQVNERIRWANEPTPDSALLRGPAIYVCKNSCPHLAEIAHKFEAVEYLATLSRERHGVEIARYSIYGLRRPVGPVLDPPHTVPRPGGS